MTTEFKLTRRIFKPDCTIGDLQIPGHTLKSLEDCVREVPGKPVSAWKFPGVTAIPRGRYRISLTMSPRFKRMLPLLEDVPGFSGIRIHTGNFARDTEGCLLVGLSAGDNYLNSSKLAFEVLMRAIDRALSDGELWITVE